MKQIVMNKGMKIPLKIWTKTVEQGTMEQATNLAKLPFAFKHIALMPDCHQGYGMPIGGVLATKDVIIPNAVGVDIGCGMIATKLNISDFGDDQYTREAELRNIMMECRELIPMGAGKHGSNQFKYNDDQMPDLSLLDTPVVSDCYAHARRQLGTLGGGNHFIEFQKGSDGHVWIMIHSGSRNLGHKVATFYNNKAKEEAEKWYTSVPEEHQLAFLPIDTRWGWRYQKEMEYCVEFARLNRMKLLDNILYVIHHEYDSTITHDPVINVCHNFARRECHYGSIVWVHRKGATPAYENQWCIIPGSQGTKSYICLGRGNIESFKSCSHGAGRTMSRRKAQDTLDLATEQAKMEGIIHSVRTKNQLDEAPGSYKDIRVVMSNQEDLVDVAVTLTPLAVMKG
jgi:tRNA-splicing ligase RtcB